MMNMGCLHFARVAVCSGIVAMLSAADAMGQRENDGASRPVAPDWRPAAPEHSGWTQRYYVDTAVAPQPSAEEDARGFMLYSRPSLSLVFDNSVPHADDRAGKLACRASPGEYESMTLAVYALRDLDGVSLRVGDLKTAGGARRIPASQVEVHVANSQYKRITERAVYKGPPPRNEFMYMPRWLFVEESVDMQARQSAWFWITVHVPDTAEPGTYSTDLTVYSGGQVKAALPVRVEVLPIRLAQLSDYAIGYYFRTANPVADWSIEARMAAMRAYGMTSVHILLDEDRFPKVQLDDSGKVHVDIFSSNFNRAMGAYKTAGFPAPPVISLSGRLTTQLAPYADPRSARFSQLYLAVLQELRAECERSGWPVPILNPLDEAVSHGTGRYDVPRRLRLIQQAGFMTEQNHFLAYPHNTELWRPACLPHLDVITLIYSTGKTPQSQPPWQDCVDLANDYGKTLWIYNALWPGSVQPMSWRFMNGWFFRTWGKDVTGSFYYCFDERLSTPKNDLKLYRGNHGDASFHAWHRPDPQTGFAGGPAIDTACAREGIDDLRYIVTLERLILEARSHERNAAAQKAAEEAEGTLQSIIASFDFSNAPHIKIPNATAESEWEERGERDGRPTVSGEYLYRNGWSATEYDLARQKIAQQIIRLQAFLDTL
jgi:hypothetical protein